MKFHLCRYGECFKRHDSINLAIAVSSYSWATAFLFYCSKRKQFELSVNLCIDNGNSCFLLSPFVWDGFSAIVDTPLLDSYKLTWNCEGNSITVVLEHEVRVFSVEWIDVQNEESISMFDVRSILFNDFPEFLLSDVVQVKFVPLFFRKLDMNCGCQLWLNNMYVFGINKFWCLNADGTDLKTISIPYQADRIMAASVKYDKSVLELTSSQDEQPFTGHNSEKDIIKAVICLNVDESYFISFNDGSFLVSTPTATSSDESKPQHHSRKWSRRGYINVLVSHPTNCFKTPFAYEKSTCGTYSAPYISAYDLEQCLQAPSNILDKIQNSSKFISGVTSEELSNIICCTNVDKFCVNGSIDKGFTNTIVLLTMTKHIGKISNDNHICTLSISNFDLTVRESQIYISCKEWINLCGRIPDDALKFSTVTMEKLINNNFTYIMINLFGKIICKEAFELSTTIFMYDYSLSIPDFYLLSAMEKIHYLNSSLCIVLRNKLLMVNNYHTLKASNVNADAFCIIQEVDIFQQLKTSRKELRLFVDETAGKTSEDYSKLSFSKELPKSERSESFDCALEAHRIVTVKKIPKALRFSSAFNYLKNSTLNKTSCTLVNSSNTWDTFKLLFASSFLDDPNLKYFSIYPREKVWNDKSSGMQYFAYCWTKTDGQIAFEDSIFSTIWVHNFTTNKWKNVQIALSSLEIDKYSANVVVNIDGNQSAANLNIFDKEEIYSTPLLLTVIKIIWFQSHTMILLTRRGCSHYMEFVTRKIRSASSHQKPLFPHLHRLILLPHAFIPVAIDVISVEKQSKFGTNGFTCDSLVAIVSNGCVFKAYEIIAIMSSVEVVGDSSFSDEIHHFENREIFSYKAVELWSTQVDNDLICMNSSNSSIIPNELRAFAPRNLANDLAGKYQIYEKLEKITLKIHYASVLVSFNGSSKLFYIDGQKGIIKCIASFLASASSIRINHEFFLFDGNALKKDPFASNVTEPTEINFEGAVYTTISMHPALIHQRSLARFVDKFKLQRFLQAPLKVPNNLILLSLIGARGDSCISISLSNSNRDLCHINFINQFGDTIGEFVNSIISTIYLNIFESLYRQFREHIVPNETINCGDAETMNINSIASSNYEGESTLLLSFLQLSLYSVPIYCVEFRCFVNWIESYVVDMVEEATFSYHDKDYQAFSSFLYVVYPNLFFEIFTKLARRMEPSIVKSMFPLCYQFPFSFVLPTDCRKMQTAVSFFGNLIGNNCNDEFLICGNRMLSVACEIVGGSSSHFSTIACIILGLQLLHRNTTVLSCKYMMELSDFILRLEAIYRSFCKTSTVQITTAHLEAAYQLILDAHCGIHENTSNKQDEETLWNWMWNIFSGQKQQLLESIPLNNYPCITPEVYMQDIKKMYFAISCVDDEIKPIICPVYHDSENGGSLVIFSITALVKGSFSMTGIAGISLVMLSLLESVQLRKFIVSHLHSVAQHNVRQVSSEHISSQYFASHVDSYTQFRAHKLAQQLRVQKFSHHSNLKLEKVSSNILVEIVTEHYLRRLLESDTCGKSCDEIQYFELSGEYYGSEYKSASIPNELSGDLKSICLHEDTRFFKYGGRANAWTKWEVMRSLICGYLLIGQFSHVISMLIVSCAFLPQYSQETVLIFIDHYLSQSLSTHDVKSIVDIFFPNR